jgi:hypothetical protein
MTFIVTALTYSSCVLFGLAMVCEVLSRLPTRRERLVVCADRDCDGCFESWVRDDGVRRPCRWRKR